MPRRLNEKFNGLTHRVYKDYLHYLLVQLPLEYGLEASGKVLQLIYYTHSLSSLFQV